MNQSTLKKRAFRPRPLSFLIAPLTSRCLSHEGMCWAQMVLEWHTMVSDDIALYTRPKHYRWHDGTGCLTVSVLLEKAFTFSYQQKSIIDQINRYFGFTVVTKLAFKKTPQIEQTLVSGVKKNYPSVERFERPSFQESLDSFQRSFQEFYKV